MVILEQLINLLPYKKEQIEGAMALRTDGNTIPFIARYRKEQTGGLLDEELRVLFDKADYLERLEDRKAEVLHSLETLEVLTSELSGALGKAQTLSEVEDIYRPYKPKKNTLGSIARGKGLEPLGVILLTEKEGLKEDYIQSFINEEKEVNSMEEALTGAMHIVAEKVSDDPKIRNYFKQWTKREGVVQSKVKEENPVYAMYEAYEEPYKEIKNHRILALLRGEKEGALSIKIVFDEVGLLSYLESYYQIETLLFKEALKEALKDGMKRLLLPSIERELFSELKERSETGAIDVFKKNLKQLLLSPPVKNQVILGFDPAFRTGCKLAVIDAFGQVLETTVIFPTAPQSKVEESRKVLLNLIKKHGITAIALGNGTASRESEAFIVDVLKEPEAKDTAYTIVSESGASVYSASSVAREEFPDMDVTLRSAVSIARRLLDPLAELVKIDPKAIGVGQYQHDVNQKQLGEALSGVVEGCVNYVGVDVNQASVELLNYVAGLSRTMAKNLYTYRKEVGRLDNRKELLKVKGIGPKAFAQCAGFLRIKEGSCPFDNTGIHPESYALAEALLEGKPIEDVQLKETVEDIRRELAKPGREPREDLPKPVFKREVLAFEDLKEGMIVSGVVRNVVDFGAFVDLGVHQDGLIHISQITNRFISHPLDVLAIGQVVESKIISLDKDRKRIGLSMKDVSHG